MSVYEEILEWSSELPTWQRDALRRLASGALSESDYKELEHLCLQPFGLKVDGCESIVAMPLESKHLPIIVTGESESVTLATVKSVQNVNLLDPASILAFHPTGITVIYGDNGSGKSGYTRILKKMCRARDAGSPICPNIYKEATGDPAQAVVDYCIGDDFQTYNWVENSDVPNELARVSIFDSDCAKLYVNDYNDVAYRPFGLDLFDRLSSVADVVGQRLADRKSKLVSKCLSPPTAIASHPEIAKAYPVHSGLTMEGIKATAVFTTDDMAEMKQLSKLLEEENPLKKAASIRVRKQLLIEIEGRIVSISTALGVEAIKVFRKHVEDRETARTAASLAQTEAFKDCLPGTGADPWKQLWEHARSFSVGEAYPDASYPNTGATAVCVLCQQPLSDDAKERLKKFEAYVKDESAKKLNEAAAIVKEDRKKLEGITIHIESDDAVYQELKSHSEVLSEEVTVFLGAATKCREVILSALGSSNWENIISPTLDVAEIKRIAQELEQEAENLEKTADQELLEKYKTRLAELEAKKWIHDNVAVLRTELQRVKDIEAINKATGLTNTNKISRKGGELTKKYVTEDLQERIKEELKAVSGNQLKIVITHRTRKGVPEHRIDIEGRKLTAPAVKDIVSEGEFRAIALAAFFAELGQSYDKSAILVDDPVCSLDHAHRRLVAERLAKESTVRQVIVLTHDIVFMNELFHWAETFEVDLSVCQVLRNQSNVGVVCDGPPWQGQSALDRIKTLTSDLTKVKALYDHGDIHEYKIRAGYWYGSLRETWERTTEEMVLNGVVMRFSRQIQTQRLKIVARDLTEDDYKTIENGMAKSSRWLKGHDQPGVDNANLPTPDEMKQDLKDLTDYIDQLKKRKRSKVERN
ncbi:MAG: AAA family ATPase [Armatimonadota bacterium]